MEVHTVIETEDSFDYPLSVRVVGSYESLYFAQNAAANRILKRAQKDSSFAYAIWNDVNHGEEFREYMLEKTCRKDISSYFDREKNQKKFPEDVERIMCLFLLENVGGEDAYHIYVGNSSWHMIHFDIIKNELMMGGQNEV